MIPCRLGLTDSKRPILGRFADGSPDVDALKVFVLKVLEAPLVEEFLCKIDRSFGIVVAVRIGARFLIFPSSGRGARSQTDAKGQNQIRAG